MCVTGHLIGFTVSQDTVTQSSHCYKLHHSSDVGTEHSDMDHNVVSILTWYNFVVIEI